jgi:hypothetical protein
MSDDLVKQLRDVAEATGPNHARQIALDAAACIEALEARVSAAEKALSQACASLDGIDATGPQEFYLALAAYQTTKEGE